MRGKPKEQQQLRLYTPVIQFSLSQPLSLRRSVDYELVLGGLSLEGIEAETNVTTTRTRTTTTSTNTITTAFIQT